MAFGSMLKTIRGAGAEEVKYRISVLVLTLLVALFGLITIVVSGYVYVDQKKLVWDYIDPQVNPPALGVALGCFIGLVTVSLGAFAAWKFQLKFLKVYACASALEAIVALIVGLLVMLYFGTTKSVEIFEGNFKAGILNYLDITPSSVLMDTAQVKLNCCGAHGYKDWMANKDFNCSTTVPGPRTCSVPDSCCISKTDDCGKDTLKGSKDNAKIIHRGGCVETVERIMQYNANVVGAFCLVDAILTAATAALIIVYVFKVNPRMTAVPQTELN